MTRFLSKKRAGALMAVFLIASGAFFVPRPAHALFGVGDVVFDPANFAVNSSISVAYQARKGPLGSGLSLDTLGWMIGKIAIQMMTKSVVNWINSGFSGSPSFVTNFGSFLTQVADVTAGSYIGQLSVNVNLNSPFQSIVAQHTAQNYALMSSQSGFFASIKYTLNGVTLGDASFLAGDFSKGGWGAFYSASQHPQNNPIGAQMIANAQLQAQVAAAQGKQATQLGWGQGFLSWCGDVTGGGGGSNQGGPCHTDDDCAGALACVDAPVGHCAVDASLENPAQTCTTKDGGQGTIQTPGSVIQSQINQTLGIQGDTLVTADEFNEVIGALISQLVTQVLGGGGLSGVASVSAGGTGYIDQATDPKQTTDATASSTQNSMLVDSINTEVLAIQQYQSDLSSILSFAQDAKSKGDQCVLTQEELESLDKLITDTQAAQAKAAIAATALQKISSDAATAIATGGLGLSQSSPGLPTITEVSTAFQAFLASPTTPTTGEMNDAHKEAADLNSGQSDDTLIEKILKGLCES
jgi:hypothetical protein